MEQTLTLRNPIMINGVSVKELKYDMDGINAQLFARADTLRQQNMDLSRPTATLGMEFDYQMHLYLGFAAIVAASNNQIDFVDLENLHGIDITRVVGIGRNFTLGQDASAPSSSDGSSETTQGLTTLA